MSVRMEDIPGNDEGLLTSEQKATDEKGKKLPQFIAGISANIMSIVLGLIIGWTSSSLAHLEAPDSPLPITKEENSWISSLMPLAAAIGPFGAGYSADAFGRKRSLLLAAPPVIISYVCLAIGEEVWVLYLGRFIAGFFLGWTFTVLPMYTGEIAENEHRGTLGTFIQIFIGIGLLFDYCVGPYVPYMWLSIASIAFPVLFIVCFAFCPESPYFLLMKDREEDARRSLMWLRGKSAAGVATELKIMKTEVEEAAANNGGFTEIFSVPTNRKALLLCVKLSTHRADA